MASATEVIDPPVLVPSRGRRLSRRQNLALAALVVVLAAAGTAGHRWWTAGRFIETTDDAYVGGDVTEISPHVSGFVSEILVADNQAVATGQPLVRIASSDFQAALDHASAIVQEREASLSSLQAKTSLQHSLIDQARAELSASRDSAAFAADDARRYRDLALTHAGTGRDADKADTADRTAQSAVSAAVARSDAAKKQLTVLDASVGEARAALAQARAELQTARLNLGYTEIRAPIDGYVGDRSAQVGAYVSAGTHLLSVVPAGRLWIDANFKEDQIGRMRRGQPIKVVIDVMPGRSWHGHLLSLAPATGAVFSVIPAQNATGNFTKIVQRLPVRVVLDDVDARGSALRPGLSATVSVDTRAQSEAVP